jgi:predicted transcriptional regulator
MEFIKMATSSILAFRVPETLKQQIEKLSVESQRKKSDILLGWITEKVELENWQIQETKKAIKLADVGKFATSEQIIELRNKWII